MWSDWHLGRAFLPVWHEFWKGRETNQEAAVVIQVEDGV